MDAVDRAHVFLAAVRDRLRRLSSMRERKPAQRGQGIDEKDVELRQAHKLGVGRNLMIVRRRVGRVRRERGIWAADGAGQICELLHGPQANAGDRKSCDRKVAGFDIDEQRLAEHFLIECAEKRRLPDAGRSNNERGDAALLCKTLLGTDQLHGRISFGQRRRRATRTRRRRCVQRERWVLFGCSRRHSRCVLIDG